MKPERDKTLEVVIERKESNQLPRRIEVDISKTLSNMKNIVTEIMDGPLRIFVDDAKVEYSKDDGLAQITCKEIIELSKERIQSISDSITIILDKRS